MLFFRIADNKLIMVVEARHAHIPVAKRKLNENFVYLSNSHYAINAFISVPPEIELVDQALKDRRHCLAFYCRDKWLVIYEKLFRLEMHELSEKVRYLKKWDAVRVIMDALKLYGTVVLPMPDQFVDDEDRQCMNAINAWADAPCERQEMRTEFDAIELLGPSGENRMGMIRFYAVDRDSETEFYNEGDVIKFEESVSKSKRYGEGGSELGEGGSGLGEGGTGLGGEGVGLGGDEDGLGGGSSGFGEGVSGLGNGGKFLQWGRKGE